MNRFGDPVKEDLKAYKNRACKGVSLIIKKNYFD